MGLTRGPYTVTSSSVHVPSTNQSERMEHCHVKVRLVFAPQNLKSSQLMHTFALAKQSKEKKKGGRGHTGPCCAQEEADATTAQR
jgi:hypothetical protein